MCRHCREYFENQGRRCTAETHGECDCPRCQGACECHREEEEAMQLQVATTLGGLGAEGVRFVDGDGRVAGGFDFPQHLVRRQPVDIWNMGVHRRERGRRSDA